MLLDVVDGIDDLEEDVRECIGVRGWALASVDTGEIGHMALVTLVQVLSIPAAWEMDLCSETARTVHVCHPRSVRAGLVVVQTSEARSLSHVPRVLVGLRGKVEGASSSITSENLIALREGDHFEVVIATAQVVDDSAACWDINIGAVAEAVVELRRPVCALVVLNTARCAKRTLVTLES